MLKAASWAFPEWDEALARDLVEEFDVPLNRRIKKLSRGRRSAIGVVVGISSRAELTIFDEVADLLDHVVVIDAGKILIDAESDALLGAPVTVAGVHTAVQQFTGGRDVLARASRDGARYQRPREYCGGYVASAPSSAAQRCGRWGSRMNWRATNTASALP